MKRKILYVDMDGVLVDFMSAERRLSPSVRRLFSGKLSKAPGVFGLMDPMPGPSKRSRSCRNSSKFTSCQRHRGATHLDGLTNTNGSGNTLARQRTSD